MLKKSFVRNRKGQLIGSETTGFSNGDTVVRDSAGRILGTSNDRFQTTRDASNRLLVYGAHPDILLSDDE